MSACGSASPAAPIAPVAALTVAVSGSASLGIGQTAQFTAATSDGQDVTIGATWLSSDITVARVSTFGVVTAVGKGAAIIRATYKTSSGTSDIRIDPVQFSTPTITSCGTIVTAGSYTLANDIAQPVYIGACINIQATAVQLDCGNHSVTGIRMTDVSDVTVTNCALAGEYAVVTNSTRVTFEHNALSTIYLIGGHANTVRANTIDGGYDGSGGLVGQDDGVVLGNEADDTIVGNTIRNAYDAGIEGVDSVSNTLIANNTIANTGSVGIGAYWCTRWTGNTVSGNTVTESPGLVRFVYSVSSEKCLNVSTVGAFLNNTFADNRFSNPRPVGYGGSSMSFSFPKLDQSVIANNLFRGNDLGSSPGPEVTPFFGFINGGGNVCAPYTSNYCGG